MFHYSPRLFPRPLMTNRTLCGRLSCLFFSFSRFGVQVANLRLPRSLRRFSCSTSIFFHSSTHNNAYLLSQRCSVLPCRLWYARSSIASSLLLTTVTVTVTITVTLVALLSTMVSPMVHIMYQPMADANFIVAITSVACNRLILSLRSMGFTKGPIRAFDIFDNSGRPRLESRCACSIHSVRFHSRHPSDRK